MGSPAIGRQSRHRMCASGGTPAPLSPDSHEPVQIVSAMRATVWPATVQRAKHPLLLADEQSHQRLPSPELRVPADLRPIAGPSSFSNPHSTRFRMGGRIVPSAGTYKSCFTQNVNFHEDPPSGVSRHSRRSPPAGPADRPQRCSPRRSDCERDGGESAPGGNRTRGLRLERPLLFGSPKRTVDH